MYIYIYIYIDNLFIISRIFDKFGQLLSHSLTTVTWKFVTESSVFHGVTQRHGSSWDCE